MKTIFQGRGLINPKLKGRAMTIYLNFLKKQAGIFLLSICLLSLQWGCSSKTSSESPTPFEEDSVETVSTDELEPVLEEQESSLDPMEMEEISDGSDFSASGMPETPGQLSSELANGSNSKFSAIQPAMEALKVSRGDTLMKLAFQIYGDIDRWKDLYELNKAQVQNPNQLKPGISLQYEKPEKPFYMDTSGESYLIQVGDTLGKISDSVYGTSRKWRKIYNKNKPLIKDPNRIYAGFTIYYDLTPQELAEAEARKRERMAAGKSKNSNSPNLNEAEIRQMQSEVQETNNPNMPGMGSEVQPQAQQPQVVPTFEANPMEDDFSEIRLPAAE